MRVANSLLTFKTVTSAAGGALAGARGQQHLQVPGACGEPRVFPGFGVDGDGGCKSKMGAGVVCGASTQRCWRDLKRSRWELARPQKVSMGAGETSKGLVGC